MMGDADRSQRFEFFSFAPSRSSLSRLSNDAISKEVTDKLETRNISAIKPRSNPRDRELFSLHGSQIRRFFAALIDRIPAKKPGEKNRSEVEPACGLVRRQKELRIRLVFERYKKEGNTRST